METQIAAQVLGVSGRTSRDGQHQMYDVALSDGNKYTTFDPDLAGKANGLQGQQVSANVAVEQKGRYTNYNLLDIGLPGTLVAPAGGGLPIGTAIPVAGAPVAAIPSPVAGIPMAPPSGGGGMSDADKARISRFSAASTAFGFVGALFTGAGPESGEQASKIARALTETLVNYGYNGTWQGVPASPAAVAAAVPGVQVGVEGIQQGEAAQAAAEAQPAQAAQGTDIPWD